MFGIIYLTLQESEQLITCNKQQYFTNQYISDESEEQQNTCTNSCENNVWYKQIIDQEQQSYVQICMENITTCKELSNDTITYKLNYDYQHECTTKCTQDLWYDNNQDYICYQYTQCSFSQEEFKQYVIKTQDNQCVDQCQNSVNCKIPSQDNSTCYYPCQDSQYLIYEELQCSTSCDPTFYYEFYYEGYNMCQKQSCKGMIFGGIEYYLVESSRKCASDCKQIIPYIYQQEEECVTSCSGNFASPYDKSNNICDDKCTFVRTSSQGKQCTQDGISCPDTFPIKFQYQQDPIRYQCVKRCSQQSISLYLRNDTCVYQCGENSENNKQIVWRKIEDEKVCDDQNSTSCVYNNDTKEFQDLQTSQCLTSCSNDATGIEYKYYYLDEYQSPICSYQTLCNAIQSEEPYYKLEYSEQLLCVINCKKQVWTIENDYICINTCNISNTNNSINLNVNQCNQVSQQECEMNLYIKIEYHNTYCQYIPNASKNRSIDNNTKLCTSCQYYGYEVKQIDGIDMCVEVKQEKISTGAIIGIVFGIIFFILICIFVCWFAIRYFHISICCFKAQKNDNDNENIKEMNEFKNNDIKERQVGDDIKQYYL